jgi:SAM-dependent methyltransferase
MPSQSANTELYSESYYLRLRDGARRSAQVVVPLVLRLVEPNSVVDVGCALGTWLRVFQENGISDIHGVDRPHVDHAKLEIPRDCFMAHDLRDTLDVVRTFDLVLSLEVAEHLPEACADQLVEDLTALGPVVLFSAAIPDQGGAGHVNEQLPDYWAKKFEARGFVPVDALRMSIWQNAEVDWWYAQNMLLYVHQNRLSQYPNLLRVGPVKDHRRLKLIHPQLRLQMAWRNRVARAAVKLATVVPQRGRFILVDQDQFGEMPVGGQRQRVPFMEQGGQYAGPPSDGGQAVAELERLRGTGAGWIVFGWTAFWWLDFYSLLHEYLRARYASVIEDEDLIVFDVR